MVEPTDVAAEPARLETLVRNLKELRRSPDSGTFTGQPESFGFAPPAATVRLWAGTSQDQDKTSQPAATLEVGKSARGIRYVRPGGVDATEVVDAKLLSALDLPLHDWREPVVMSIADVSGHVGQDQRKPARSSGPSGRRTANGG